MSTPSIPKGGSGKLMRQGQTTSGLYGDDPKTKGISHTDDEPSELKK